MICDILGKSLHHQMILGPPDGSLDLFLDTRGFWLNGLRRKSILKNDTQKQYIPENWEDLKFLENADFVNAFFMFFS